MRVANRRSASSTLGLAIALLLASCGGGQSGDEAAGAAAPGAVTKKLGGSGERRMRALAITPEEAALAKWEPLVNLSLVPAAGAVMGDGRVLLWASNTRTTFGGGGHTFTTLFDPGTNTATERDATESAHDMFCPGTARLPDGRLLVNGGVNANRTSIYDPATNLWSSAAGMQIPRGYNASTVLADGTVMTLGGSWSGGTAGGKSAEIYTPATGWRVLSGVPYDPYLLDGVYNGWQTDAHAAIIPTGNGRVLMAGPSPNMAWIDTRGNGSSTPAGRRGDDQPSLGGPVVMYDAGKILKVGGATWNGNVPATAGAYLIDTTGATAAVKKLSPMAYPRMYANSVALPNGQVLVVGGQTYVQEFSDSNAVLAPELWDPETETFTVLPPMAVARNYHSLALLLPDGRVMSAGGGLCGCAADKPNLQIMSPPYLFNRDGSAAVRPVITAAPASVGYGTTVQVSTDTTVSAFSMVRLGATTHTVNNDQRRVSLAFTAGTAGSYQVAIPSNPGILVPGQWMLFAMNANGTPSVAKIVTVSNGGAPTLENPGNLDVALGGSVSVPVVASTPSGTLAFSASGLPAGVTVNPTTGAITGSPTAAGSFLVTLRASNGAQTVSTDLLITVTSVGTGTGLLGQYHAGTGLAGTPLLQRVEVPDFDWGTGSPGAGVGVDNFSVRWSGWIEATATGPTQIRTSSDDGVRVWIDDRLVIDNWTDHAPVADTAAVAMVAGQRYRVTMEYYELGGGAVARLQWLPAGAAAYAAIPATRLYPAPAPSTTNVALGRTATQSSDYAGIGAAPAVDGNTDGVLANNSTIHTLGNAQEWWQVDLGGLRRIDLVQLWNRTDCCSDRLQNFTVFVSATDMTGRSFAELGADPAVMKRVVGTTRALPAIGIPVNGLGRYVRVQLAGTNFLQLAEVQVFGSAAVYNTPSIAAVANQTTVIDTSVSLATSATDPDANPLGYSATGLPSGLAINAGTGRISGTPDTAGTYSVTVTAANAGGLSASTTFTWTVLGPVPQVVSLPAPLSSVGSVSYAPTLGAGAPAEYSWNFGDGTADTAWSSTAAVSHSYAAPGIYTVTLTVRTADGRSSTARFVQAIVAAGASTPARASANLLLEPRAGTSARLWVVNPDNDSVSVFDAVTKARVAEITVGAAPRTLARAADGRIWVVNKGGASISIVNPATLAVAATVALPRASQPFGIVFSPADGSGFVALEGSGSVLKLNGSSGATTATLAVGDNPRHLALTADGAQLLVSRFITRALPGEGTVTVSTAGVGGEVLVVDPATMAITRTVLLAHSDRTDNEVQGRGVPNYLGAAAIAPDGRSAWVPSKQDNILRGTRRDGRALDFQNTVRAISSRIDLASGIEDAAGRVDHDNSSVASAAVYHPSGAYLFVALETTRQVAVLDPVGKRELFRFEAGLAPQGVVVADDGRTLYTHNFMARTVSVIDLGPLLDFGQLGATTTTTLSTVTTDKLAATVLKGKQLFYDARDPRLARDGYMSCAACHNDGGHDGRTWDLSGQGEGLRNTINLRGRAALGQGFLHWSANFNEVQDFEAQIRGLAGGTGLMTDAQFNTGTRSQPLGDAKAGVSADLDALAAYVASLSTFSPSPLRNADGSLTTAAAAGRTVFAQKNCASCHAGTGFTGSGDATQLKNIGTIKASSGSRLGGTLTGIDVPTLRDVWATAPYLHDGSAATLADAVAAHNVVTLTATELANVVEYLKQIGSEETTAPTSAASGTGLRGQYFGNITLSGTPVLTRTEAVNFSWGTTSPGAGVPSDNYSARWTGTVEASATGNFRFQTNSDDGVRVWVNGVQVINNWTNHSATLNTTGDIALTANQRYTITVEYYERTGQATMQLRWRLPGTTTYVAVPASRLYTP